MKQITKLCLLALLLVGSTHAFGSPENKPFAEERIVLQISDPNPFKQTLVLNVANNLIKHYGTDKVDIEIVAFGPGLRLLFKDNANKGRIDGLTNNGVEFAACMNTMTNMGKALGQKPDLHASASPVPAGVVRIIELQNQGYKLIKP